MTLHNCICEGVSFGGREDSPGKTHHPSGCKIRALFVLLAVLKETVQCPDAIGNQVMRLEEVQVLEKASAHRTWQGHAWAWVGAHVVVNTDFHILALFLLLLDETSRQTAAACIDDVTALLPLD